MDVQRTVTIFLEDDQDLRDTLEVFRSVQQRLSPICYNNDKPIKALQLHRGHYHEVKGELNSQMTITAIRLVAAAYVSARKNYQNKLKAEKKRKARYEKKGWNYRPRNIKKPGICQFKRRAAMFLVGERGRDASFRKDGKISIWTIAGRKKISYTVHEDFRRQMELAKEIDSITIIERHGKLIGRVAITLEVPDPQGIHPIGIDLNETNAMVAVDPDGNTLFISGKKTKVANKRSFKTRKRLQKKLASHKAQKKDTRSVRRLLKRQGRKNSNRSRTFAQTAAKQLCQWASPHSVLVFEDLNMPQPQKGTVKGESLRRRLSLWSYGMVKQCVQNTAEIYGLALAEVNPAYTSKTCSRCGLIGIRKRHRFECKQCGFQEHADINAAINIRDRFIVSRHDGQQSACPEALERNESSISEDAFLPEGKPTALAVGS